MAFARIQVRRFLFLHLKSSQIICEFGFELKFFRIDGFGYENVTD